MVMDWTWWCTLSSLTLMLENTNNVPSSAWSWSNRELRGSVVVALLSLAWVVPTSVEFVSVWFPKGITTYFSKNYRTQNLSCTTNHGKTNLMNFSYSCSDPESPYQIKRFTRTWIGDSGFDPAAVVQPPPNNGLNFQDKLMLWRT